MRRRTRHGLLAALIILAGLGVAATSGRTPKAGAAASFVPQCADRFPATRDPANPLMLSTVPQGGDPLRGASLFVDGPAHGDAAGAIARLLGIDPDTPVGSPLPAFRDSESWTQFARYVKGRLPHVSRSVAHEIRELEKIASEPETQRISRYSEGGTPAGIYGQTQKLFCHNFTADPGAIPVITTYFMHATLGGCPSTAQIDAYRPEFEAQIDALAQATGRRPVVYLLELDAVGSSACIAHDGGLPAWESMLRYEATTLEALPHTVVYLEGGYSDANSPAYAAKILNASGVRDVQGFFTNDTHNNWTSREITYAEAISKLTGGAHFIIDTAENGNGPKLNPHPVSEGVEDLCNPPGRALGPRPTSHTAIRDLDALLWTHVPGASGGSCGGGPPSGGFWAAYALGLAERANARFGPHDPSLPY